MAGKVGSSSFAVLLADGYDLLAAKVQTFTHKIESILARTDGLGDSWEAFSPVGLKKAMLTQDGAFFDDATNGMHAALNASEAVSRILCFAFQGNTIGSFFVGCEGVYGMAYDVLAQLGNLTKANVAYQVTGQMDRGTILQHQVAKTADWNTKTLGTPVDYSLDTSQRVVPISSNTLANPTVITTPVPHGLTTGQVVVISGSNSTPTIDGKRTVTVISATTFSVPVNVSVAGTAGTFVRGSTVSGGAGYQQISAFSGFTGFIGKIRSSPDDITYADLITFTNVTTGPIAERKTVAGTVDQYLCFDGDVTGAGSITPFVGFARA